MKLKKLIMIWFTVGIICSFMAFGAVVTPGINIAVGMPTLLFVMAVNLGFFLAVMWTWVYSSPTKPKEGQPPNRGRRNDYYEDDGYGDRGYGDRGYGDRGYEDRGYEDVEYGDDGYNERGDDADWA